MRHKRIFNRTGWRLSGTRPSESLTAWVHVEGENCSCRLLFNSPICSRACGPFHPYTHALTHVKKSYAYRTLPHPGLEIALAESAECLWGPKTLWCTTLDFINIDT